MTTFFYFAYGSNLLRQRLKLKNPSAHFIATAVLKVGIFTSDEAYKYYMLFRIKVILGHKKHKEDKDIRLIY